MIEGLYQEAVVKARINQELQKKIGGFCITTIPTDQLYQQVTTGLAGLFVSGDKGYTIFLDYLYDKDPKKFEEILERANKENKLMSLINDIHLAHLSDGAKRALINSFMAQGEEFLQGYRDRDGNPVLIWAAMNGHVELIEALDGKIHPNIQGNYDRTALMWVARSGHVEIANALKGFPYYLLKVSIILVLKDCYSIKPYLSLTQV